VSTPRSASQIPRGPVVFDASFLIALLDGEDAAQRFTPVLSRGIVPAVTAGEVFYKLHAAAGIDSTRLEGALNALGITLVDLPVAAALQFPALKSIDRLRREEQKRTGGRRVQALSLGDLCCLGYALHTQLPVLTADRHWNTLAAHGLTVAVHDFRDPGTTP